MSHSHLWHQAQPLHQLPFDLPDDPASYPAFAHQPQSEAWATSWDFPYDPFALAQSTSTHPYANQQPSAAPYCPAGPFPESSQRTVLPEPQRVSFDAQLYGDASGTHAKLSAFNPPEPCDQSLYAALPQSDKGMGGSAFAPSHCRSSSMSASASHASSRTSVSSVESLEHDVGNFAFANALHQMHPALHAPVPLSYTPLPPSRRPSNSAARHGTEDFHGNSFVSLCAEAQPRNVQSRASTSNVLAYRPSDFDAPEDAFPLQVQDEVSYESLSSSFFVGRSEPPRRASAPDSMRTARWHAPPSPSVSPAISATSSPSVLSEQSESGSDTSLPYTTQPITSPPLPASTTKVKRKSKMHCCEVCGKAFPRPSGLSTHMNSHSGEKPFKCQMKDCPKTFTVRSNAKRHLRTHGIHLASTRSASSSRRDTDGGAAVIGFEAPVVMDVQCPPDTGPGGKLWKVKWMGQSSAAASRDLIARPGEQASTSTPPEGPRVARADGGWGSRRAPRADGTGADLPRSSQWGIREQVPPGPVASSGDGIFAC